jgi:uncharacterized protein (DUF169 family)
MLNYKDLEQKLSESIRLRTRPVAVTFSDVAPAGVEKFAGSEPSGCSFWRLAAEGKVFYTIPSDHYNCAIGCYTHHIPLPPEREKELGETLALMTSIGYIRMEEVGGIHRLPKTPGVVIYAALGETPTDPDVVIFAGRPGRLMSLHEAALRAGSGFGTPVLPRPTCMALPAALAHGSVMSTACIGNRIYTDLEEDELYVAISGRDLRKVVDELETAASANSKLSEYHHARRQALRSIA